MASDSRCGTRVGWGWRRTAPFAAAVATVGFSLAGPNAPAPPAADKHPPTEPAKTARLERHLADLDITGALAFYDTLAAESGPSVDLLARIARADLAFCLREGKGWDRFEAVRVLAEHDDPAGKAALDEYLESEIAAFRTKAMDLLEAPAGAGTVAQLKARSADPRSQPHERVRAALALHLLGEKSAALQALRVLVESSPIADRAEAAGALAALEDPAAMGTLKALLDDPSPPTALVAALGLMRLGDPAGRERLVRALDDSQAPVRLLAAWHLAQVQDRAAFPAVTKLVEEGFAIYPDLQKLPYELEWAVYVLSWIDPVAARPSLDRMANTPEWFVGEVVAGRRLAELGDPQGLAVLQKVDAETKAISSLATYRVDALRYAAWYGDVPEVRTLAKGAVGDPNPHVRATAMEILARLGDEAALPAAREMLGGIALIYRSRAAEAILAFGKGPRPRSRGGEMSESVPRHGGAPPSVDAGKPVQGAEKTGFCG